MGLSGLHVALDAISHFHSVSFPRFRDSCGDEAEHITFPNDMDDVEELVVGREADTCLPCLFPGVWRPRSGRAGRERPLGPARTVRRAWRHCWRLYRYPRQSPAHPASSTRPYSYCIYTARGLATALADRGGASVSPYGFWLLPVSKSTSSAPPTTGIEKLKAKTKGLTTGFL